MAPSNGFDELHFVAFAPPASPLTPTRSHHSCTPPHASAPLHDVRESGPCRYAGFAASRALLRGSALQLRQRSSLDRLDGMRRPIPKTDF